jgi:prepilin-type N-terminal cleavage/methylation domain-containing protein
MPRLRPVLHGRRRGLTLPELLIAITLLAIVGGGVTRVMVKQQQFYKDASKTAGSKRELRLGASVLPAELRSISSSGGDILTMDEGEVKLRAYIGSSVICARTATNTVWLPPVNLTHHTLTSFIDRPDIGDTVFVYNENIEKGSEDDLWEMRTIIGKDMSTTACPGAPYTDAALDPPATKRRYQYVLDANLPDSVKVGAVIRFTRPVRYRIYQESSGAWYLGIEQYTGGSWGAASPLSGPYKAFASGDNSGSGLQFRYFDSLGVRITNMANKKDVARVDVYLRTDAGASAITERKGNALKDSVLMRVAIRNFK